MKKEIILMVIVLILLFTAALSKGQIFYGGVWITNQSSNQVYNAFVLQTNTVTSQLAGRTLQIVNILTNQTFTLSYGYSMYGSSNIVTMGVLATNFTAGNGFTNGQTVTIPIAPVVYQPIVVPWGVLSVSNGFSNLVYFQ